MKSTTNFLKIERALKAIVAILVLVSLTIVLVKIANTEEAEKPEIFGIVDTTHSWLFNASTSGDYTFDPDVVRVDNDGAGISLTANKFTNDRFTSDGASWTSAALAPTGWIEVPGNTATYNTENFLVMKYEAKAYDTITASVVTTGGTSAGWAGVKSQTRYRVISTHEGKPWVYIAQNLSTEYDAIDACSQATQLTSIGGATHLLTNAEWMTIARNIESQPGNWSLGSVGSGYIFAGHNDNSSAQALAASTTDTGGNRCAYTDSAASSENPGTCPTNTSAGTSHSVGNQVRTLTLSNGEVVWDFAGNVLEWGQNTILGQNKPASGSTGAYTEWSVVSNYGTLSYDLTRPANSSYLSAQGAGMYFMGATTNGSEFGFLRGGNWSATNGTGVFNLVLSTPPGSRGAPSGFRCATDALNSNLTHLSSGGRDGGALSQQVGNVVDSKLTQTVNLGDTDNYNIIFYAYNLTAGSDGGTVDSSVAEIYYNGSTVTTNYTNVGSGWWRMSADVVGANQEREFGILVKKAKSIKVDDASLTRDQDYTLYTPTGYNNPDVKFWTTFTDEVSVSGDAQVRYQLCTENGSDCQNSNTWVYWTGATWDIALNNTTHTNVAADLDDEAMLALDTTSGTLALKVVFDFYRDDLHDLNTVDIGLITDSTPPPTNAAATVMDVTNGEREVTEGDWANNPAPFFSWTAGADNPGGSGIKGYCLYLGQDQTLDPEESKGILGVSPMSIAGTDCSFIIADPEIDFATLSYRGDPWLTTDTMPYYINIKAIDNAGLIYTGASESFSFLYDYDVPTNVAYISPASGTFNAIADMNFSWPTNGAATSTDVGSGLLGWQYSLNNTTDWRGTLDSTELGVTYIPVGYTLPHHLTDLLDGSSVIIGNNVVYFRTIDIAGNLSNTATYRTGSISYGGNAPLFPGDGAVTITPGTNTSNSFALSWPAAMPADGNTIASYYYMINTSAPATLATLTGNSAAYIPTTSLSVPAGMLGGAQRGSNEVRVVAVDDADNYSPSNSIVGTFTLDSSNPDPAQNVTVSDASIKAASLWRAAVAWEAPDYQGTGVLTYIVYRSDNGTDWTEIARTTGNAYLDTVAESRQYYWRLCTIDTSDASIANPSFTGAVTLVPRGAFTEPATLTSGPDLSGVTTRRATINWTTNRNSDSKIAFGTSTGEYFDEEISNSAQVTSHTINISNLFPGTTYYYVAKWTDEDGNTGVSTEKTFTTSPAPIISSVRVTGVNLTSATITYTVQGATAVRIYYGTTTAFGGMIETLTSTATATYSTTLSGLTDGQTYYFKINQLDTEAGEYQGPILEFTTLPRPRISNVQVSQVQNTAQPTIQVNWLSNTLVSSIVTYYPADNPGATQDAVDLELTSGEHEMIIESLLAETTYELVVKGQDFNGNQGQSDVIRFTTASDTRPPAIFDLRIEGGASVSNSSFDASADAQLIVSWKTDEPATSQVEFGEGTGEQYLQKTQQEENLKTNHLVVITGLSPSKVYHLRALSSDSADNNAVSPDNSVITPKAPDSALSLVIRNLLEIFGFLN